MKGRLSVERAIVICSIQRLGTDVPSAGRERRRTDGRNYPSRGLMPQPQNRETSAGRIAHAAKLRRLYRIHLEKVFFPAFELPDPRNFLSLFRLSI